MRGVRSGDGRPVVVIGGGVAGVAAAGSLRANGYHGPLILISDECALPYRRSLLPAAYLRGELSRADLLVQPAGWYREARIDLLLGARATRIDRGPRTVEIRGHGPVRYDRLVLATGVREDIPVGLREAHGVRSVGAVDALRAATADARSAIVVGADRIASDAASSLAALGLGVTLLAATDLVGPVARGPRSRTIVVTTAAGGSLRADLVVRALGMQPDAQLALDAGLASVGGVLADRAGRTIDPAIFATGGLLGIEDEAAAEAQAMATARAVLGMDAIPTIVWRPPSPAGVVR